MVIRLSAVVLWLFVFVSCKEGPEKLSSEEKFPSKDSLLYNEPYRPQFHFSPTTHWMNDPNGLVYNNGFYHLYYQYYPDDIVWGPMHWGHARSKDLIHWEHRAIALYPDSLGYIFSGSAVVDKNNSSGFAANDIAPMVAMYTYHDDVKAKAGKNDYQTQGIAYSLDNGDSWKKYEGNPVIGNSGMIDFRDPKVFWYDELQKWVLILVAGDHALFYQSDDLKNWIETGQFGKNKGSHGGVWECPDLFKLPVQNGEMEKWVLLISINPGGVNQGSATQYFIGDFDGNTFTADHEDIRWLDYGRDNYAGVTYNNDPNGSRIFIGWMSNWDYGQQTPTETWRSAMTIPRRLSLEKVNDEIYLKNNPIPGLKSIVGREVTVERKDSIFKFNRVDFEGLKITFKMALDKDAGLALGNDKEEVLFGFKADLKEFYVDRTKSGKSDFSEKFAEPIIVAPKITDKEVVEVEVLVDRASVEIFIDGGLVVLTNQVFPTSPYNKITFTQGKQAFENLTIHSIKSIWHEE